MISGRLVLASHPQPGQQQSLGGGGEQGWCAGDLGGWGRQEIRNQRSCKELYCTSHAAQRASQSEAADVVIDVCLSLVCVVIDACLSGLGRSGLEQRLQGSADAYSPGGLQGRPRARRTRTP